MSEVNAIKIVIDTNIWISFLIGKKIKTLKNLIINGKINVYFSKELIDEFIAVIKRPKLQKYFIQENIYELINLFSDKIVFVEPNLKITECRDKKDNFLLELAISANVDYIITGDKDLLELNPFRNIQIVNPINFENLLYKIFDY